jgi:lipopolysaccharide/colanic/teichoic acid biosynthesis glycosyltransferase
MLIGLTLPLMAVIAMVMKCHSRGPVFERDKHLDKNGTVIVLLKFRTRPVIHKSRTFTRQHDSMTPVGRVLHHARLDQLPGLFSVLQGKATLARLMHQD